MSIHKKRSGSYQVRWREHGRLKSKNFSRKIDAERFEASIKLDVFPANPFGQVESPPTMTFQGFSEIWLRDYGLVHKTEGALIHDRQIIRDYLIPSWGNIRIDAIARRDIAKLQGKLIAEKRLKEKTINIIVGLAHKMFKVAAQWDYIKVNPAEGLPPIRLPEQDYRFWTFDERDRFLSWAKAHDPELYLIIAVAVNTGLRRGEMEGLLRDCLDFERRMIVVRRSYCSKTRKLNEHTKGKKIRRVPMNDLVYQQLRARSAIPMNHQVLPYAYHHLVERCFKPAQERAKVSSICFHDLRHTFASHMAMAGVSAFDIQKVMGHSDIKTTMRYMHLSPDHLIGLTDVLNKKISSIEKEEIKCINQAN
ncbi:MAG TPA: tyrosine-type recombinase/integrase [Oligoflexus sp.]|uniref:tyrosine-type recombinase/integrase n=1 Tax=Oligoflexus sp. TaxID=1971216 RepID=UPI002D6EB93D|nr:tyrosine-type recombinase/integrase [Oligoflexus sp.]HYX38604.1 tyrosine-type recombinase/integrase [Oligoflexus sp.]